MQQSRPALESYCLSFRRYLVHSGFLSQILRQFLHPWVGFDFVVRETRAFQPASQAAGSIDLSQQSVKVRRQVQGKRTIEQSVPIVRPGGPSYVPWRNTVSIGCAGKIREIADRPPGPGRLDTDQLCNSRERRQIPLEIFTPLLSSFLIVRLP